MRALLTLAAADGEPATADALAASQGLPSKFLGSILNELRRAGIVASQRGAEGGYRLARPASSITFADVMRALDGPLAEVRGLRPEATTYEGAAERLQDVWVAVRASLRNVLEHITLEDVVARPPAQECREADSGTGRLASPLKGGATLTPRGGVSTPRLRTALSRPRGARVGPGVRASTPPGRGVHTEVAPRDSSRR